MLKTRLDNLKDHIKSRDLREKSNYDISMWAIYNKSNNKEFLFFIQEREYKSLEGINNLKWYYSGVIFEINEVMNKKISVNNLWSTFSYNISEEHMKPLELRFKEE